ncbi:MAG: transposase, partial [Candidatus Omnitrophica bacterium]|nr:transposase [Candidatus Omnitrophota bacterium]
MKNKRVCPKCSFKKVYAIRRGKWRCAGCKYEWDPLRLPLYLSRKEWVKILKWFLRGISSPGISYETGINRWRILRALTKVRLVMSCDIPAVFSGTIEIDET